MLSFRFADLASGEYVAMTVLDKKPRYGAFVYAYVETWLFAIVPTRFVKSNPWVILQDPKFWSDAVDVPVRETIFLLDDAGDSIMLFVITL